MTPQQTKAHAADLDLSRFTLPVVPAHLDVPLYTGDLEADVAMLSRRRALAEGITGGLMHPGKMPSAGWGISAEHCRLGSLLVDVPGSTCESCYAMKGRFRHEVVQRKLDERYEGLFDPLWTPAMVVLIRRQGEPHFRWFVSGDVQGENHLRNIIAVCRATPDVQHWLPTREHFVVRALERDILRTPNLLVRVSATMVDGPAPGWWAWTSRVVTSDTEDLCPAPDQGGNCCSCRDCWSRDVANVSYRKH